MENQVFIGFYNHQRLASEGEAFVAWTNTDCTEGRGENIPLAICFKEATAQRMGKKGSVQGSNCYITKVQLFRYNGQIYGPVRVHFATREDDEKQKRIDARNAAIEKAKAAGLTDDEIRALA